MFVTVAAPHPARGPTCGPTHRMRLGTARTVLEAAVSAYEPYSPCRPWRESTGPEKKPSAAVLLLVQTTVVDAVIESRRRLSFNRAYPAGSCHFYSPIRFCETAVVSSEGPLDPCIGEIAGVRCVAWAPCWGPGGRDRNEMKKARPIRVNPATLHD